MQLNPVAKHLDSHSSLYLATHLLTQFHFAPKSHSALLNAPTLARSSILELGSGTGLLAILLRRTCRNYTASDQFDNLKLVQRNLELNGVTAVVGSSGSGAASSGGVAGEQGGIGVEIEEVDWVAVSSEREQRRNRFSAAGRKTPGPGIDSTPPSTATMTHTTGHMNDEIRGKVTKYDLILAVDCIFNESLVLPLVDTFAEYAGGRASQGRERTAVIWVVVELRSSDVVSRTRAKLLRGRTMSRMKLADVMYAAADVMSKRRAVLNLQTVKRTRYPLMLHPNRMLVFHLHPICARI